ncbi:MAG: dephospho-CoA kinase [Nitrospinae bacterium]|nr:dephospho-CoA kinase [Nitrospinota bacterium]
MTEINFRGKVIGLTGGIGSGKSTLASLLEKWGAFILDSDKTAQKVVLKGTKGFQEIIDCFGKEIVAQDGEIDRAKLASIIFHNREKKQILEKIIYPLIKEWDKEEINTAFARNKETVIIKNSPLLIESGLYMHCYKTILIVAEEPIRMKRILKSRPLMSKERIEATIRAQMNDEDKKKYADFVIENNHSRAHLAKIAEKIILPYF